MVLGRVISLSIPRYGSPARKSVFITLLGTWKGSGGGQPPTRPRLESLKQQPHLSQPLCVKKSKLWQQAPEVLVEPGMLQVEVQAEHMPGHGKKRPPWLSQVCNNRAAFHRCAFKVSTGGAHHWYSFLLQ